MPLRVVVEKGREMRIRPSTNREAALSSVFSNSCGVMAEMTK